MTPALGKLEQKDCQFQASLNNNDVSFQRRKFRSLYQPTRPKEGLEQPAAVPCAISRLPGLIEILVSFEKSFSVLQGTQLA